jgi:hypothetical protein
MPSMQATEPQPTDEPPPSHLDHSRNGGGADTGFAMLRPRIQQEDAHDDTD